MTNMFNSKLYIDFVLLLCLTLLLAQIALAQSPIDWSEEDSWSNFPNGAKAACADNDIDNDNDGLIELCYLEDVNAMHNNLSGTSLIKDTITHSDGCGGGEDEDECFGYELVRDLDFNDDDSYGSTANKVIYTVDDYAEGDDNGWRPIGNSGNAFASIFEGNGHTISNLTINRPNTDYVGLFGRTESNSKILNIGLLNVDVRASNRAGGLVGQSEGTITNNYATGHVTGNNNIGGLVGFNIDGNMTNNYATASVEGSLQVGGLAGYRQRATITNSYASGDVAGGSRIGGLVGGNQKSNVIAITNSYATGSVTGNNNIGGLVGSSLGSGDTNNITNSYWDTSTTRVSTSDGGTGKDTTDLQSPTTATGIYMNWDTTNWDYGTGSQYPALKYAQACDASQQPVCGTLLRGQRNNQPRIISPTTNTKIPITNDDTGTIKTIRVEVSDDDVYDKLTLLLDAINEDLVVLGTTKTEVFPNGKPERDPNEGLSIRVPQEFTSEMPTLRLVAVDNSGFGNAMSEPVSFKIRVIDNYQPIIIVPTRITLLEDTSTTLTVVVKDADVGDTITVQPPISSTDTVAMATIRETGHRNYTLEITTGLGDGTAEITITANDGKGEINSETTSTFTVEVEANQKPTLNIVDKTIPPIEIGAEENIRISIRDANFDIGDSVTLEVTESTQSVVSGIPEDDIVINSNTTRTFTFTGLKVGETEISFTATDSKDQSSTDSVLLSVFSSLELKDDAPTEDRIVPINEMYSLDTSTFFTQIGSGISYAETGLPQGLSLDAGTGVISGTPSAASMNKNESVTVTASDGKGGSAKATFKLLINAEPTGMVTISPKNTDKWLLEVTTDTFTDANGDAETHYQWWRVNTEGDSTVVDTDPNEYRIPLAGRAGGTKYRLDVTIVDNIGKSVTTSSNVYTVENEAPMITSVMPISQNRNEDDNVSVTVRATDENDDKLTYKWSVTEGATGLGEFDKVSPGATLSFDVPPNWIVDASTETDVTKTLELEVAVSDGSLSTTKTAEVVVTKINNGVPTIRPLITRDDKRLTLRMATDDRAIAADPDGEHGNPDKFYRWQWCQSPCSLWMDISDATTATYIIPDNISDTNVQDNDKFRIKIGYTDGQGYSETIFSGHRAASADADFKVRTKVFLEGPLQ